MRWETYENLLDVAGIGEEHNEAVESHAPTSGRGQTMLEAKGRDGGGIERDGERSEAKESAIDAFRVYILRNALSKKLR